MWVSLLWSSRSRVLPHMSLRIRSQVPRTVNNIVPTETNLNAWECVIQHFVNPKDNKFTIKSAGLDLAFQYLSVRKQLVIDDTNSQYLITLILIVSTISPNGNDNIWYLHILCSKGKNCNISINNSFVINKKCSSRHIIAITNKIKVFCRFQRQNFIISHCSR